MLAEHFLEKYSVQYNRPLHELSRPRRMQLFVEYDWPGNIRELENLIKRAVVLGANAPIRKESGARHRDGRAPLPRTAVGGSQRPPARAGRRRRRAAGAASTAAPPRPTPRIARRGGRGGNYSLKDISRTAAREAERELILQDAAADTLEPEGDGGDPRHQLQSAPLQDQRKRSRQGLVTT